MTVTMDDVPNRSMAVYGILDEMADQTFVDKTVVNYFGVECPFVNYELKYMEREVAVTGYRVTGLRVPSLVKWFPFLLL